MLGSLEFRRCRKLGRRITMLTGLFFAVLSLLNINSDYTKSRRITVGKVNQKESSSSFVRNARLERINRTSLNTTRISPDARGRKGSGTVVPSKPSNHIAEITQPSIPIRQNSCVWSPYAPSQCSEMLRERLTLPITRFLLFGDSTIHNLFWDGILHTKLVDDVFEQCPFSSCELRTTERCDLTYGLPITVSDEYYLKPNLTKGEGPAAYGYSNPRCSDCSGCSSRFVDCIATEPERRCLLPHGGFVHMEFARDVVWQTRRFRTTQENTANMLLDGFAIYPDTACVMAAGLHDMDVPFNDVTTYIRNVKWYLSLYLTHVCEHVVWLANASPASDNYTQTIARTKEWNEAVLQELRSDQFFDSTTYIDLWAASQTGPHADNIHMDGLWNIQLTELFVQLWSQSPQSLMLNE